LRVTPPVDLVSATILSVVLLTVNATRLLSGLVLEMSPLTPGHDTIGFGATLDSIQMHLAGGEAAGLAHRELATLHAVDDALALIVLTGVVPGRIGKGGAGNHDGQGREHH
jgi:hypothetical protein